jgi:putative transposase
VTTKFPIALVITDGLMHDGKLAIPLMKRARWYLKKHGYILADVISPGRWIDLTPRDYLNIIRYMPGRIIPLVTDEIYHVYNRGLDRRPTFTGKREFQRAKIALEYYRIKKPPEKLSKYLTLKDERRNQIINTLNKSKILVEILSFCFMTNHFHLLLKQKQDNGISTFLSNFQNSYTRYFNAKHKRDGSLFMDQFKAVRIETDEQLMHVSRYIHLNPYTSFMIKSLNSLENYLWSSYPSYLENKTGFVHKKIILNNFKDVKNYKEFVYNRADYQKNLKRINHLIME